MNRRLRITGFFSRIFIISGYEFSETKLVDFMSKNEVET